MPAIGGDMKCTIAALTIALGTFAIPASCLAHGGGLDANGCHTKRSTGEYHCHRPQVSDRQAEQPAKPAKGAQAENDPTCHTGPRGGRYRIVNGKKRYGC